jgi:putative transposase
MNNVSVFMKELKQTFTVWYNKKHKRFGTLWSERFRNVLVEDRPEVVQTVAAYIDLNPVRAGLVLDPSDYRFCGYAEAAAGNAMAIAGIASFTGAEGGEWRRVVGKYREALFTKGVGDGSEGKPGIPVEKVREIWRTNGELSESDALRLKIRYMKDGAVLGSRVFVEGVFQTFRDRFGPRRTTGARPMRHLPFKGLFTLRDLRVSVVG